MVKLGASLLLSLTALLGTASHAKADGLYTKNSPVLQVDAKSYDSLIARSNYPSVVEFYAPWCGHCQNLKPTYETAARKLRGLAKAAAINCDDDANKAFCATMGVQGFPTLKIVVPSKKVGKPVVEDYRGERSAKGIVGAVTERIPNHVRRVGDKDLAKFLGEGNETAKAVLFTKKGTTSATIRALAIDFLGKIKFAQIRDREKKAVGMFGVEEFPKFVLLPGGEKEAMVYEGEMNKKGMLEFLRQVEEPNPVDAPPKEKKGKKEKKEKKDKKDKKSSKSSSTSEASSTPPSSTPTISRTAPPIPLLTTPTHLRTSCLTNSPRAKTCVLAILDLPSNPEDFAAKISSRSPDDLDPSLKAPASLSEIAHKHAVRGGKLFPFYSVPLQVEGAGQLLEALGGKGDAGERMAWVVAVNAKRGWARVYEPKGEGREAFGVVELEAWVDEVRMGEGRRLELPRELIVEGTEGEKGGEAKGEEGENDGKVKEDEKTEEKGKESEADGAKSDDGKKTAEDKPGEKPEHNEL